MKIFWAIVTVVSTIMMIFDVMAPSVQVKNLWSPAPVADSDTANVYMTISAKENDTLTSVQADTAAHAVIHNEKIDKDGVKTVTDGQPLEIPGGQDTVLKPDGSHIVLTGLRRIWVKDQKIHLIMNFANKGVVEEDATMQDAGTTTYVEH